MRSCFGPETEKIYVSNQVDYNRWDDIENLARKYSEHIVKENSLTHNEAMALLERCKAILSYKCKLRWNS